MALLTSCVSEEYKASRGERKAIAKGNEKYVEQNYGDAMNNYREALGYIPESLPGKFNSALSQIRNAENLTDTLKENALKSALMTFDSIAKNGIEPDISSKSFYNMGNVMFNARNMDEAIKFYKEALRINPNDSVARRNLRIAQLNQPPKQPQDKNDNQDNKEDDKQQEKNTNSSNQDQNKQDEKKEQPQQPQQPRQQKTQPQEPQDVNKEMSDRILRNGQNKEDEVRKQLYRNSSKINSRSRSKKW